MEQIEVRDPFDGSILGRVTAASPRDVRDAVERARESFETDSSLAIDRHRILSTVSDLLRERGEQFAKLVCDETGKPIRDCRLEVERAATTLLCCAQESLRIEGLVQPCDVTDQRISRRAIVHRVPLGIVAAITPFNFPLNIPAHKLGPALAAGNAVVLKPSPKAPLSTVRLAELFAEAGLEPGMLQLVHGGAEVVEELVRAAVQAVSFTGSTEVGSRIAQWAGAKKVVMEMGGNGAILVMEDADRDAAASAIVQHRFGSAGQRCTACKRAFLHDSVYDEMKAKLVQRVASLVVGDPADEATDMGPLIDEAAARAVIAKLEAASSRGATLLCGGTRQGAVVEPTLVEGVEVGDELFCEETFGPVLPLVRFTSLGQAVRMVNSTRYGLQAAIFTDRMSVILEAFDKLEVGALIVNDGPGFRVESIPFGGVKSSGTGLEGVRYAIEEFTHLKTLVL